MDKVRTLSVLDDILPSYRFRERHGRTVAAPPQEVWNALLAVTARELPLSSLLMGIRAIPAWMSGRRGRFRRGPKMSVIDEFISSGFRRLLVDPPHVLVAGAALQPWRLVRGEVADVRDLAGFRAFNQPGFVLAIISFELEPFDHGTLVATETRVQPTDAGAGRAFLPYWLAIRAGSGLIRREMLRAVARRASGGK